MSSLFVLLWMLFNHVLDDYFLQGILASMKQKTWWKDNAPDKMYKYDYIVALIMHSISWTFMIMLPIAALYQFNIDASFVILFIVNIFIHANIDNAKANLKYINLVVDQSIHLIQIIATYLIFINIK
jgi:hypothetical protein